ncbi:TPA: NADH-quinone oxidoreductase subunit A [Candidatus Poribacteria bacterium]|nr:NADH-quinone oxidoreductase subunit A [Candidatus Poribacteria bacterium]
MLSDFANVLIFLIVGCVLVLISVLLSRLLHKRVPTDGKYVPYECGEDSVGDTRIKFNLRFYIIALVFLIFDVEIALLFPWGRIFKQLGLLAFIEMLIFVAILLVGLAYVWGKGDLEWVKTFGRIENESETNDTRET